MIPSLDFFVAERDGSIDGYILFFPIMIVSENNRHKSLALAPIAVSPKRQRKGIGTLLIETGLKKARNLGHESVIVLGYPEYYQRFGFKPARKWNINAPFDVPDDVFMAAELVPDGLKNVSGTVHYPDEFNDV